MWDTVLPADTDQTEIPPNGADAAKVHGDDAGMAAEDQQYQYEPKRDSMEYGSLKALWELKAFSRANLRTSREMAWHSSKQDGDPERYKKSAGKACKTEFSRKRSRQQRRLLAHSGRQEHC